MKTKRGKSRSVTPGNTSRRATSRESGVTSWRCPACRASGTIDRREGADVQTAIDEAHRLKQPRCDGQPEVRA